MRPKRKDPKTVAKPMNVWSWMVIRDSKPSSKHMGIWKINEEKKDDEGKSQMYAVITT